MRFSATVIALVCAFATAAEAQALRENWVPGSEGTKVVGDLWTFDCPPGGTFEIFVDTVADGSLGKASLDPAVRVRDGYGTSLAYADDAVPCSVQQECNFTCPAVQGACGDGNPHSIAVRGAGGCTSGSYRLYVDVHNANGALLSDRKTRLGGGPNLRRPTWLGEAHSTVPLLDDSRIPAP